MEYTLKQAVSVAIKCGREYKKKLANTKVGGNKGTAKTAGGEPTGGFAVPGAQFIMKNKKGSKVIRNIPVPRNYPYSLQQQFYVSAVLFRLVQHRQYSLCRW